MMAVSWSCLKTCGAVKKKQNVNDSADVSLPANEPGRIPLLSTFPVKSEERLIFLHSWFNNNINA